MNEKRRNLIVSMLVIILILLCGCSSKINETNDETTPSGYDDSKRTAYLKDMGYSVVESNGVVDTFTLEKNLLTKHPYMEIWSLQACDPQSYFGKTIDLYSYTVKNHKLDNYGDLGETQLWLLVCDKNIIGGYSLPNNTEQLYGGVYSLEGLTLEEVTGEDYQTWLKNWKDKYN